MTGTAGQVVIVEASSNFVDWNTVTTLNLPAGGSASFEDASPLNSIGARFYRVRVF